MRTKEVSFKDKMELGEMVRGLLPQSNCLKNHTAAAIVIPKGDDLSSGGIIISTGTNSCAPLKRNADGSLGPERFEYGERLEECPRMAIKTGTSYELCAPVHAEVRAILNVRENALPSSALGEFAGHLRVSEERILSVFTEKELERFKGAILYLVGHYWACDNCLYVAKTVGIGPERVVLDEITAKSVQAKYILNNTV